MMKAAFFDVDGTLLSHVTHSIPQSARDSLSELKAKGIKITELKASGGLSQMSYLMQFQADITGTSISVTDELESTALGAGKEAFIGSGTETFFPAPKIKTFLPRLPEEKRQRMLLQWRDFVKHCRTGSRLLSDFQ